MKKNKNIVVEDISSVFDINLVESARKACAYVQVANDPRASSILKSSAIHHIKTFSETTKPFKIIPFYKEGDNQETDLPAGVIIRSGNNILVSYRGTSSHGHQFLSESADDLKFLSSMLAISEESYQVHKGFLKEFETSKSGRDQVLSEIIKNEKIEDFNFCFSGFSMGGAVAQISAIEFFHKHKIDERKMKIITFGSPRVFKNISAKKFAEKIKNSLSIVNKNDLVHKLPGKILGYFSSGNYKITVNKPIENFMHSIEDFAGYDLTKARCNIPVINKVLFLIKDTVEQIKTSLSSSELDHKVGNNRSKKTPKRGLY